MKIAFFVYLTLFVLMMTACGRANNEVASSANSVCITQPSACQSGVYQQSDGYTAYTNSNNPFYFNGNTAYLCNCPYGYVPTYNGYAGLGCVQTSYFGGGLFGGIYGYMYLGWGGNQWSLQAQLYNYSHRGFNNCFNGAIQSCVVGQNNTCPAGSACRQNSRNSNLGLCVTAFR